MPLGSVDASHAWIERENPSSGAWSAARTFIAEIGDQPWRAPSVQIPELSNQPVDEVRAASLRVSDEPHVLVWYRHDYATDQVDVIEVTNL